MNLIERIDVARARWNVLEHPFYRRWERGELTHEALSFYAAEYRHAVVALADAAAAGGDSEHAAEEAAHVGLWDDFAAALDAPLDREPTPESASCAEAWRPPDSLEARAVLYAVESSQPEIARTKLRGLVDHYGFTPGSRGTEYFELHAERDEEHAAASAAVLHRAEPEDADRLVGAATAALEGNWRLLDGIESRI
ncbi:MAG: hypothetical protein E6G03_07510 [Actinobacteria bacterium]|nr:MAG: hypothetical protein E6G03_07510 [Actinomycetota bacterium]